MRCGVSTACYFPLDTCAALERVAATGAPITEVFLNTFSEAEDVYVQRLGGIVEASGIEVVSVHPFSSMLDGYFFASTYESRMADGLALYRRYFEICNLLGAKKLVFHGDAAYNIKLFPAERYAENFGALAAMGREYGVALLHENVYYCRLNTPADVAAIKPLLGENAAFVLDTKQAHRAGVSAFDMAKAMAPDIRHVHISDFSKGKDCLLPGGGAFDFTAFLAGLRGLGYDGDLIIEVYSDCYTGDGEVRRALEHVQALL